MERAEMNRDLGGLELAQPSGTNSHAAPSLRTEKRRAYAKEEDSGETEVRKLRNIRRKEQTEKARSLKRADAEDGESEQASPPRASLSLASASFPANLPSRHVRIRRDQLLKDNAAQNRESDLGFKNPKAHWQKHISTQENINQMIELRKVIENPRQPAHPIETEPRSSANALSIQAGHNARQLKKNYPMHQSRAKLNTDLAAYEPE